MQHLTFILFLVSNELAEELASKCKEVDMAMYERDGYREELEQLRTALNDLTQDKEVADECDGVKQRDVIERIRTIVGDLSEHKELLSEKKSELQSKNNEIIKLRNGLRHCKYI